MARSKKQKQWTGILAEPIVDDIETLMPKPYWPGSPECEQWLDRYARRMIQLQIAKLPELARQLGMQVDKYDRSTPDGLRALYMHLALNLAVKLGIPGFMEPNTKWPRQIVYWALVESDERRARGERGPDLAFCLKFLQLWNPKFRRNKSAAIRRAKTLRNEISKLRRQIKAQAEAEPPAAQASNIIKVHKIKSVIL